jgi:hypothetical protein
MDLPDDKPREPFLSTLFDYGSDLEHHWVRRLHAEGVLLSKSPAVGDDYQTVFLDSEHWLSGASDAIILPPFWRKSHCCEVKTTGADKISAMKANRDDTPFSHQKYLRQLKTYIALTHEQPFAPEVTLCKDSWAITREFPMGMRFCPVHRSFECEVVGLRLAPPDDGTLIYSSRDDPLTTVSYYVEYDPEFMAAGRARLAEWRGYYERGEIPPHPLEGQSKKWNVSPCRFCGMKAKACKPDYTGKVTSLAESHGVEHAEHVRGHYDYDAQRASVLDRWHVADALLVEEAA